MDDYDLHFRNHLYKRAYKEGFINISETLKIPDHLVVACFVYITVIQNYPKVRKIPTYIITTPLPQHNNSAIRTSHKPVYKISVLSQLGPKVNKSSQAPSWPGDINCKEGEGGAYVYVCVADQ